MPGRGARSGMDARRAAAVLLLVAVAAVGLRAGGAFSSAGSAILGISKNAMYWGLTAAEGVLAAAGLLLLVYTIWARKSGKGLPQRKRRSIWWLLLLPIVVFGLTHTFALLRRHRIGPHLRASGAPIAGGAGHHHPPGSPWPVLVLFGVAAVAAAVVVAYRRRPARPPLEPLSPGADAEPLAEALAAGEQALGEDPDPRAAIIGCYAAMERSLADAGSPAEAADTPAEVLARATAGGLVRSTSASLLTGLFRRARYSSHPMSEADRAGAREALAQVRADLGSQTVDVGSRA